MRKLTLLFVLTPLIAAGCNTPEDVRSHQQKRLKNARETQNLPSDSPSIAISGQIITYDELLNSPILIKDKMFPLNDALKPVAQNNDLENFRSKAEIPFRQALGNKISYILIYEMAKNQARKGNKKENNDEVDDKFEEAIDQQVEKSVREYVISEHGGDYAKAQEYLESQGTDWENFKESQRRLMLISSQLPQARPITYPELLETYELMKEKFYTQKPSIQIRLIDIDLARYRAPDPNRDKLEQAGQLAQYLTTQFKAGADFAQLANQYSHGHNKIFGGLWKPTNPENLEKPYDIIAIEAEKMEPGQISNPIVTDPPIHIFIMKLEDKKIRQTIPLRQVQRQVEEQLVYQRRQKAAFELDKKIQIRAALAQTDDFIDLCLDRMYKANKE